MVSVFSASCIRLVVLCLATLGLTLIDSQSVAAQNTPCPDPVPQTTGTYRFRRAGDILSVPVAVGDCQSIGVELRWSNGANNGSNFLVTFLDENTQPIFSKLIWGFMTGIQQFPFASLELQPALGSMSVVTVPASVTIQAVQPFAAPSSISYRVVRVASRHPQPKKAEQIDEKLLMSLRTAGGRLLAEGRSGAVASYTLEELAFSEPRQFEVRGGQETVTRAFRLTLNGSDFSNAALIWIGDVPLQAFWTNDRRNIATVIFDESVLRDDAEISVSDASGSHMRSLPDRLKLPANFRLSSSSQSSRTTDGSSVVEIHNAVRAIGATRQTLVQIELSTNHPFPAVETPLQLRIGRRFFLNELSGDHTGRKLTLTLTAEMFSELKDDSEIVAFYDNPGSRAASGENTWYFGRLRKSMLSGDR